MTSGGNPSGVGTDSVCLLLWSIQNDGVVKFSPFFESILDEKDGEVKRARPVRFMTLCLSETDIRAVLHMPELMDAMEAALVAFSSGGAVQPVRPVVEMAATSFFAAMPGFLRSPPVLGAKLVAVIGPNRERGLPTHRASILLFDAETGGLLALLDGRLITEMRTAAVSAVSAKYMARRDARVLTILGSGVQARSHLEAMMQWRAFDEVRVWSPTGDHSRRFAAESGRLVCACMSARDAVTGADVVVLATSSPTPAIEDGWVTPGAHVISVGACRPDQREMDPALVARAQGGRRFARFGVSGIRRYRDGNTRGTIHRAPCRGRVRGSCDRRGDRPHGPRGSDAI